MREEEDIVEDVIATTRQKPGFEDMGEYFMPEFCWNTIYSWQFLHLGVDVSEGPSRKVVDEVEPESLKALTSRVEE
ncbi:hypothetical protein FRC15_006883 [Serendipita sp. 397]|nr:hypothetical protein FRC15_006883 [Serendipita sp. 397]KAG8803378.1 hypothetical protein FRC18_007321 [Serendipita sp. 400]